MWFINDTIPQRDPFHRPKQYTRNPWEDHQNVHRSHIYTPTMIQEFAPEAQLTSQIPSAVLGNCSGQNDVISSHSGWPEQLVVHFKSPVTTLKSDKITVSRVKQRLFHFTFSLQSPAANHRRELVPSRKELNSSVLWQTPTPTLKARQRCFVKFAACCAVSVRNPVPDRLCFTGAATVSPWHHIWRLLCGNPCKMRLPLRDFYKCVSFSK